MNSVKKYASFLVRLWRDDAVDGTAVWHSEIEHIQTGQTHTAQHLNDLPALLNQLASGANYQDMEDET